MVFESGIVLRNEEGPIGIDLQDLIADGAADHPRIEYGDLRLAYGAPADDVGCVAREWFCGFAGAVLGLLLAFRAHDGRREGAGYG